MQNETWPFKNEADLLLPLEALRRVRFFSRPRSLSAPSLEAPDFSFPRCLLLSSSFLFVGEGALMKAKKTYETNLKTLEVIKGC